MVEKPSETPALEPLAAAPPTTTEQGPTLRLVKAAWSGSLVIKIVLIAVAVLLLMFFIMTIAFGSSRSSCVSDLEKEKKSSNDLSITITKLQNDLKVVQKQLADEKTETQRLRGEIEKLNKQVNDLKAEIAKKETEINSLKQDIKKLNDDKEELQRQINHLNQQLREKDQEIEHWKGEVTKRDHNITTLKAEITTYIYYLIGSGGVHLAQLVHEIWVHVILGNANTQIANLTSVITNLHGEVKNLKDMITRLNNEIENLKQEITHLTDLQRVCQSELAHAKMEAEELKREVSKLKQQLWTLPHLALYQGAIQLLLNEVNYTLNLIPLYNGSADGYHQDKFFAKVGSAQPTVVAMRTRSGHVFGGAINVTWPGVNGFKEDKAAFTFSAGREKICPIKNPSHAIRYSSNMLLEFGDSEIRIETSDSKNPIGQATADITYQCNAQDPTNFYNDGTQLSIEDLVVYKVELAKKPTS